MDYPDLENLDLDLDNYELPEILALFKLDEDFTEEDLKKAKQIVLKMHPDKSRLGPEYFFFFSKAYKTLYSIYTFKNKSDAREETDYEDLRDEDKNEILDQFFQKHQTLQDPKYFNAWFNEQFDKTHIQNEDLRKGYGDYLESEEDVEPETQDRPTTSYLNEAFERKKKELMTVIPYQDAADYYSGGSMAFSNVAGDAPEEYSSDVFSQLSYQDIRKAHKESIIPVTMEDYDKVTKFTSVDEMIVYRTRQEIVTKPLSEEESLRVLEQRNQEIEADSNTRAFRLAKQMEESKHKTNSFWSSLKKITND